MRVIQNLPLQLILLLFILQLLNFNAKNNLIYLQYLSMLFRIFGSFWFCADKFKYTAAETVLSTVFNSNLKTTIFHDNQNIEISRLLLHDQIFQKLGQMVKNGQKANSKDLNKDAKIIDRETYDLFKKMFTPSQGILLQQLVNFSQTERLTQAQNTNKLVTICLDPVMFKLILMQMYRKNINGKLIKNQLADNAIYIVGTPGLGKSVKLIGAKILLDMRIRHIIKNGVQSQSEFAENYKFLYFHADLQKQSIMEKTLEEVKKDFDIVPDYITSVEVQNKSNYSQFMSQVSRAYKKKKIRLRLILDQMNFIYNAKQNVRAEHIHKWKEVSGSFELPVIMVSSKNNQYLQKYDPVIQFSDSSHNNVRHKKIILDNLITPQQRLAYTYNCVAFELLKLNISPENLTKVIQNLSIPLLTHLTISRVVQNVFKEQSGSLDNQNYMITFNEKLKQKQNYNEVLEGIKNMFKTSNLSSEKLNYYLEFMSNFLNFSLKNTSEEIIKLNIGFKDVNGKITSVIKKQLTIAIRQIKKSQNFRILTESNYFFTLEKNAKSQVFSCISVSSMDRIRNEISSYITTQFLKKLSTTNKNLLNNLVYNNGGLIFQEFVCNLYNNALKKKISVTTTIDVDEVTFAHKTNIVSYMFQMDKKKSYQILFKNNKFLKNASGKPVFDFILSNFKQDAKRVVFVDTTLSDQLMPLIVKQCKFKKIMLQVKGINQNPQKLMQQGKKQDKPQSLLLKKQQQKIQVQNETKEPLSKNLSEQKVENVQSKTKQNKKKQKKHKNKLKQENKQTSKQKQNQKPTSFLNQIINLLNSDSKFSLQIIYFVLSARKSQHLNIFKNIEVSEHKALKQLEQLASDDDQTRNKKKENRQIIRKGRQNLKQFGKLLKQKGLESRISIKFMHGELSQQFSLRSAQYDKKNDEIQNFPQYLVSIHKEIL